MNTKYLVAGALACAIAPAMAESGWTSDYAAAKAEAAKSGKNLLLVFTGSDWCPPCKMMHQTVFSKEEFIKEAGKNFVLVDLDFPRTKQLDPAVKKQNEELLKQYGVQGFPTMVLTTADGTPYSMDVGGVQGGPGVVLGMLEKANLRLKEFQAAIAAAKDLKGAEKGAKLAKALESVSPELLKTEAYKPYLDELEKVDPKGAQKILAPIRQEEDMEKLMKAAGAAYKAGKMDEVEKLGDDFLARKDLLPEIRQQAMMTFKCNKLLSQSKFEEAIAEIDKIIAIDPHTDVAQKIGMMKSRIEEHVKSLKQQGPDTPAAPVETEQAPKTPVQPPVPDAK